MQSKAKMMLTFGVQNIIWNIIQKKKNKMHL